MTEASRLEFLDMSIPIAHETSDGRKTDCPHNTMRFDIHMPHFYTIQGDVDPRAMAAAIEAAITGVVHRFTDHMPYPGEEFQPCVHSPFLHESVSTWDFS